MEKQKLKKMKILEATDEMVQVAENDVPIIGNMPYEKMTYPVGMLIRAEEEENIVKIGFLYRNFSSRWKTPFVYVVH